MWLSGLVGGGRTRGSHRQQPSALCTVPEIPRRHRKLAAEVRAGAERARRGHGAVVGEEEDSPAGRMGLPVTEWVAAREEWSSGGRGVFFADRVGMRSDDETLRCQIRKLSLSGYVKFADYEALRRSRGA